MTVRTFWWLLVIIAIFGPVAMCSAQNDMVTDLQQHYRLQKRVEEVEQGGALLWMNGSADEIDQGEEGLVARTVPTDLVLARVKVVDVAPDGRVKLKRIDGTVTIKTSDLIFIGKHPVMNPRYPGIYTGIDEMESPLSYRFRRTIEIDADGKKGRELLQCLPFPGTTNELDLVLDRHGVLTTEQGDEGDVSSLKLVLSEDGNVLEIIEKATGKTGGEARSKLYRSGKEPRPLALIKAAWPVIVQPKRIYEAKTPGLALEPVWSDDGTKILVQVTEDNGRTRHCWLEADQGKDAGAPLGLIGWHPSRIADTGMMVSCVRGTGDKQYALIISDRLGRNLRELPVGSQEIAYPVVQPGGQWIAFLQFVEKQEGGGGANWRIRLLDLHSEHVQDVATSESALCVPLAWSEDGTRLYCQVEGGGNNRGSGVANLDPWKGICKVLARTGSAYAGDALVVWPGECGCMVTCGMIAYGPLGGSHFSADVYALTFKGETAPLELLKGGQYPLALKLSPDRKKICYETRNLDAAGNLLKGVSELWVATVNWESAIPNGVATRMVGAGPQSRRDGFDDNSANWATFTDDRGHCIIQNSRFEIRSKKPSHLLYATTGDRYTDFSCKVNAFKLSGTDNNEFGVMFRMSDDQNYYRFSVSSDHHFKILKCVDGRQTVLQDWAEDRHIFGKDREDRIEIVCRGSVFTFKVNGAHVAECSDGALPEGQIALLAGSYEVNVAEIAFDDYHIEPILPKNR